MLPIKHIENIANTLDGLLDDYKEKDLLTEDFKIVATVGIEVKKLHKLVTENYNLNASKGSGVLSNDIIILQLFYSFLCKPFFLFVAVGS